METVIQQGLRKKTQSVHMTPEQKASFVSQLRVQIQICDAGVDWLDENTDGSYPEFTKAMRRYIYDNGLENDVPFKAVYNELYHVYKRYKEQKRLDKNDRDLMYMTFYVYTFSRDGFVYNPQTKVLSFNIPAMRLDIPITFEMTDEVLEETPSKAKYLNLSYHRETGDVNMNIYY